MLALSFFLCGLATTAAACSGSSCAVQVGDESAPMLVQKRVARINGQQPADSAVRGYALTLIDYSGDGISRATNTFLCASPSGSMQERLQYCTDVLSYSQNNGSELSKWMVCEVGPSRPCSGAFCKAIVPGNLEGCVDAASSVKAAGYAGMIIATSVTTDYSKVTIAELKNTIEVLKQGGLKVGFLGGKSDPAVTRLLGQDPNLDVILPSPIGFSLKSNLSAYVGAKMDIVLLVPFANSDFQECPTYPEMKAFFSAQGIATKGFVNYMSPTKSRDMGYGMACPSKYRVEDAAAEHVTSEVICNECGCEGNGFMQLYMAYGASAQSCAQASLMDPGCGKEYFVFGAESSPPTCFCRTPGAGCVTEQGALTVYKMKPVK